MQRDQEERGAGGPPRPLENESMRAVYRDLLRFGPRSRSELARRLGLSAPTVTRATRDLLEQGLIHPLDTVLRAKGRPQEPLDVEENHGPRFVGVKVTADEVHVVVTTVRGTVLEELVLTLEDTGVGTLLARILVAVEALVAAHPMVAGIGVGLGGLVAGRRTVLAAHLLGWEEPVDLAAALEERVHLPVVVENDLVAMLNGLHWFGLGRAYDSFAVLTVGAGVGIGTVLDGRVVQGHHHMAGLTGRMLLPGEDGGAVPVRDVASTAAVLRRARAAGVLGEADGMDVLRRLLAEDDEGALEIARGTAKALAHAAAGLIAVLDPEAIVLGGEDVDLVRAAAPAFEGTLRDAVADAQRGVVVRTLSGDFDEWARGVAVIAIQEFVGGAP